MSVLTYIDRRSGDLYDVFLDFEGEFEQALRYVDKIGFDPISYDRLCDIHPGARHEIEECIRHHKRRLNNHL
jgi:hypothetical protein